MLFWLVVISCAFIGTAAFNVAISDALLVISAVLLLMLFWLLARSTVLFVTLFWLVAISVVFPEIVVALLLIAAVLLITEEAWLKAERSTPVALSMFRLFPKRPRFWLSEPEFLIKVLSSAVESASSKA